MKRAKSRGHLLTPITVPSQQNTIAPIDIAEFRWTDGQGKIVFPGTLAPQIFAIEPPPGRERLVEGICVAFASQCRQSRPNTRRAYWAALQHFFGWLRSADNHEAGVAESKSIEQLTTPFLRHLMSLDSMELTRAAHWRAFCRTVLQMVEPRSADLYLPLNPFPLAYKRKEPTKPLTMEEVSTLLRICQQEMDTVSRKCSEDPEIWVGADLPDLMPFLFALALLTGFNPETLRNLRLADIDRGQAGRLIIRGSKPRAGKEQQAVFSADETDTLSAAVIVTRVLDLTKAARGIAGRNSDQLWLAVSRARRNRGKILCFGGSAPTSLEAPFRAFGQKCGIEELNIQRMRATAAEIARWLDGGLAVTALLGNSSQVAEQHYKSHGARRREQTALAKQMEIRGRFVTTDGLRDVRDKRGAPQSAATPGFVCADPFNPPAELEQSAGMCAAFLACPSCPQAGLDKGSPEAVAELLRLKIALDAARATVAPHRWRNMYQKCFEALPRHLDKVAANVLHEAAQLPIAPWPEFE